MELHQEVASRLATSGQRYTRTRRRLVEILARAGMPLALPDIVRGRKNLPQSSAYRNLAELEAAGSIRRVAAEDGFARYELAEELTGHHHHLMCSRCGRVQDLHIPTSLERQLDRTPRRARPRRSVREREPSPRSDRVVSRLRRRLTGSIRPRPLSCGPVAARRAASHGRIVTLTRTSQADEHAVPPLFRASEPPRLVVGDRRLRADPSARARLAVHRRPFPVGADP